MKVLATALLFLGTATPAYAQVMPIPRSDFDEALAQYRSYALQEFQTVVETWVDAVNAGALDQAAGLYTEDSYVDIEELARGRESVRALLREWSEGIRHVQVGLSDFDASGNMSYGTLQIRVSPDEGSTRSGVLLLVLRKEGRAWRIRAQTLTLL
ncbi:MAG: nuclear transport factor 2 family protein [Gemmatimonadetes bacterium]|nr:nuclear transport factor 2 family protein [Gemmatimonadota bacterium]